MTFKDLRKLKDLDRDDILDLFGLETKSSTAGYLAGALGTFGVGLLVGAGIALMLTPKTGRELREDIRDRIRRAPDQVGGAVDNIMNREQIPTMSSSSPKGY